MKYLSPLIMNTLALTALETYLNERIEKLEKDFMYATNMEEVSSLQHTIRELENLKKLRDVYLAAEKNNG